MTKKNSKKAGAESENISAPPRLTPELFAPTGRAPDLEAVQKLEEYLGMLQQWNKALNLVGSGDGQTLLGNLVMDSFYLANFLDQLPLPANPVIWEPGAGGGIPGIPLRIIWPRGEYVLIEARQKRALFLANAVARLNLAQTSVYRGDAKNYFKDESRTGNFADCVLSRAFMPPERLLPFCAPALAPGGTLIIMANEAPDRLADGWELVAKSHYPAGGKKRWLWALSLASDKFGQ